MAKQVFQQASGILNRLMNNGYEAYFVGGAVRDFVLGKTVKDVDIATSATPDQVMSLFSKTIPVGVEHGTVVVRHYGQSYEVTTFRSESDYEDFRHPSSVTFISSLEEDLKRRDFTINAMAMTVDGNIIDPFSGKKDIREKLVRAVGNPAERFREDPLRMMRALRFQSTYGFDLKNTTERAISQCGPFLLRVSRERITAEFEKLLQGRDPGKAFTSLLAADLHLYLPGLQGQPDELERFAGLKVNKLKDVCEHWALLCLMLWGEDRTCFLKKWKLPNKTIACVTKILTHFSYVAENGWRDIDIYRIGYDTLKSIESIRALLAGETSQTDLNELQDRFERLPIKDRKQLAVNGSDLIDWFNRRQGRWIATEIGEIEKAVIAKQVKNEKGAIKTWLREKKNLRSEPPC